MATILWTTCVSLPKLMAQNLKHFFEQIENQGHTIIYLSGFCETFLGKWSLLYEPTSTSHGIHSRIPSFENTIDKNIVQLWIQRIQCLNKLDDSSAEALAKAYISYAARLLSLIKPDLAMTWNAYNPYFGLLHTLATRMGIATGGLEWGLLPDSLLYDSSGVFGDSALHSVNAESLLCLPSSADYTERGFHLISDLKHKKNTQLYQVAKAHREDLEWFARSKGIKALCLGTSESQCGQYPFDHADRLKTMSLFESGWTIAHTIASSGVGRVAYKPHPHGALPRPECCDSPDLREVHGDAVTWIEQADVVISWGSKMELNALLASKPLVLVGFGMLWRKGCAFEVTNASNLVETLLCARASSAETQSRHLSALATYLGWLESKELFCLDSCDEKLAEEHANRFLSRFAHAVARPTRLDSLIGALELQRETSERWRELSEYWRTAERHISGRLALKALVKAINFRIGSNKTTINL